MKTSDTTLLEQLRLTSREIERRKDYFGISRHDCNLLSSMKSEISASLDTIIGTFYTELLEHDDIDRIIGDAETLKRLRNHFKSYLLTLFEGIIDEEYVLSRLRVGVVHRRIGVDPKYYVSAVHRLSSILRRKVLQGTDSTEECFARSEAIEKILMFDLSLTFDTYIHSLMDESRRAGKKLEEYAESLEEVVAERTRLLSERARHDGLTGLLNQRAFYEELRKELSRGQRQGYTVVLVYFDVDGFKKINDTKGHREGDALLVRVAEAARRTTREGEIVARYGGDEFCVVLSDSSVEEARILCRRMSEEIVETDREHGISCSMGIAFSGPDSYVDAESLVKLADKAMYRAKKKPGNSMETA